MQLKSATNNLEKNEHFQKSFEIEFFEIKTPREGGLALQNRTGSYGRFIQRDARSLCDSATFSTKKFFEMQMIFSESFSLNDTKQIFYKANFDSAKLNLKFIAKLGLLNSGSAYAN